MIAGREPHIKGMKQMGPPRPGCILKTPMYEDYIKDINLSLDYINLQNDRK